MKYADILLQAINERIHAENYTSDAGRYWFGTDAQRLERKHWFTLDAGIVEHFNRIKCAEDYDGQANLGVNDRFDISGGAYKEVSWHSVYNTLGKLIKKGVVTRQGKGFSYDKREVWYSLGSPREIGRAKLAERKKAASKRTHRVVRKVELRWTGRNYRQCSRWFNSKYDTRCVEAFVDGEFAGYIEVVGSEYVYGKGQFYKFFGSDDYKHPKQNVSYRRVASLEAIYRNLRRGNWRKDGGKCD